MDEGVIASAIATFFDGTEVMGVMGMGASWHEYERQGGCRLAM
jgi:hypothetical protein